MVDLNANVELRLSTLEKKVDKLDSTLRDKSDRLLCVENAQKVIVEKIDGVTKHTEAIVGMSFEVKNLAVKVGDVVELIEKQEDRIDIIENKPGKAAISTLTFIITTLVSTGLGALIGILVK